jgi:hypothetical protein
VITTFAPPAASSFAVTSPSPCDPPTTNAELPANSPGSTRPISSCDDACGTRGTRNKPTSAESRPGGSAPRQRTSGSRGFALQDLASASRGRAWPRRLKRRSTNS